MWTSDLAASNKQSTTAAKRRVVLTDRGVLANPLLDKEQGLTSTSSLNPFSQAYQDATSAASTLVSLSSSRAGLSTSATRSYSHLPGARSVASTSTARPAQASPALSTELMATAKFTLSQARGILGSISTTGKMCSSLTSIRTALNAKRSLGGWTDILSKCKSKEVMSLLDGLTSTSSRMTTGTSSGTKRSRDGSTRVGSSSYGGREALTTTWSGGRQEDSSDHAEFSSDDSDNENHSYDYSEEEDEAEEEDDYEAGVEDYCQDD